MIPARGASYPRYLIVGGFSSASDQKENSPFAGQSGQLLKNMLNAAGINPADCRYMNLLGNYPEVSFYPNAKQGKDGGGSFVDGRWVSQKLIASRKVVLKEIQTFKPEKVIGLGEEALWICSGKSGITKWRGSQLEGNIEGFEFPFLPSYHPGKIMAKYEWKWIGIEDFKRANKEWIKPDYNFLIRPSFMEATEWLTDLYHTLEIQESITRISSDIETRNYQIACMGLANSTTDAICIPIMSTEYPAGFWSKEEELQIILLLRQILQHPNAHVIGQNYIYDMQYLARQYGINSRLSDDTMIKHHTAMPGTQKGLDFLSSIYCAHHVYWKDESKNWDPNVGEEQLWIYNCKDCCATFESNDNLDSVIKAFNLTDQYAFQMATNATAFQMMLRGINVNEELKRQNAIELGEAIELLKEAITKILGGFRIFGPKSVSPTQMKKLAYDIFDLPKIYNKKGRKKVLTADKNAVEEWCNTAEPIFRPILKALVDIRSLGVYKSTFAEASLDTDRRWRCSIKVPGTDTFRWATAADAFGFGTNMQNIPKKKGEK